MFVTFASSSVRRPEKLVFSLLYLWPVHFFSPFLFATDGKAVLPFEGRSTSQRISVDLFFFFPRPPLRLARGATPQFNVVRLYYFDPSERLTVPPVFGLRKTFALAPHSDLIAHSSDLKGRPLGQPLPITNTWETPDTRFWGILGEEVFLRRSCSLPPFPL